MKKFSPVVIFLWLIPLAALARLGDGDADFRAYMTPSPHYATIVIPCFLVAAIISMATLMRCQHRGQPLGWRRFLTASLITALSGTVVFFGCPAFYQNPIAELIQSGPYMWIDLRPVLRLPFVAVIKPWAGLFLILIWFVVQSSIVQMIERHFLKHAAPKLRIAPLIVFTGVFFAWFSAAVLRMLCTAF